MKCPPIGIMQGRLSLPVGSAIQAFPAEHWADEFPAAQEAGIACIEWIYDIDGDDVNPICTDAGAARLEELQTRHHVGVESICADFFMPQPLLKGSATERRERRSKLLWLLGRASVLGVTRVILPFVDASKIEDAAQGRELAALFAGVIEEAGPDIPEIHLETSLPPDEFAQLLTEISQPRVRVNYDSGNSASLGYDADEEFAAYGPQIGSVHIKDRLLGGGTVPLGQGNADFPKLIRNLNSTGYAGTIILQVARSQPGHETAWAAHNRKIVESWFDPAKPVH
jgi:hexulose-6-phosphate isomerase